MLECINKECEFNKDAYCTGTNVNIYKTNCAARIIPTEQKENRCYNEECPRNNKNGLCLLPILPTTECKDRNTEQPIPLNYEEEYYKLKAENEELKSLNQTQSQSIKDMQKDINNLNQLIEKKDIKIEKLEKEISSLKEVINEGNEQLTNEYSNKIIIAEQEINRLNTEVACLKAFKEKDNKQIQNLKDTIKSMAAAL